MSTIIPFPKAGRDEPREGPDPELGDAIIAAADTVARQPNSARALRRLAHLLAPGISEFHADHGALSVIFARIREGDALDAPQRHALIVTAKAEAAFLITGKV
jgi:hypothetical protein